jgi:CRISPR-associated endonuclease/helicase Cas3
MRIALTTDSIGLSPISSRLARDIAMTIGGHHGIIPGPEQLPRSLSGDLWETARLNVARLIVQAFAVQKLPVPTWKGCLDRSPFQFLAGLTTVADWIGSSRVHFPWVGNSRLLNVAPDSFMGSYVNHSKNLARKAMNTIHWSAPYQPSSKTFVSLFPDMSPRPLQESAQSIATTIKEPSIILTEAPMGEGKTEFAFYLAHEFQARMGCPGTFWALPTQATTNAMFQRFESFLKSSSEGKIDLHLIHGRALLSEVYDALKHQADVYDRDEHPTRVIAERWFACDKRQSMLAPFGVSTIDQALLAVLQVRHGFVRLFGLTGKVVIFDEVHAYDTYMSTILDRLLHWLGALGSPVILLSATLPFKRRQELLNAYLHFAETIPKASYPRITWASPLQPVQVRSFAADPKRRRTVRIRHSSDDDLAEILASQLTRKSCAAVIRSTVGQAQETYLRLKNSLPDVDVLLFHARFVFEDRQRREKQVLCLFGKDRSLDRPTVLVATQVIEQSLDLDFDWLITDWAPIDLLLQRMGRLWRHDRTDRGLFQTPEVVLIKPSFDAAGSPSFGSSEFIYERYILLRSLLSLRGKDDLTIPDEIDDLVSMVYDDDSTSPWPEHEAELHSLGRSLRRNIDRQQRHASDFLIAECDEEVLEIHRDLDEENPLVHPSRMAKTRDAKPSVTVIFVFRKQEELFLRRDSVASIHLDAEPSPDHLRTLLSRSAILSRQGLVQWLFQQEPPPPWRISGMLRYCRLVELDECGEATLGTFRLRVDDELGIQYLDTSDEEDD